MAITLKRQSKTAEMPAPGPDGRTFAIPDPAKPSAMLLPPLVGQRNREKKATKLAVRIVAAVVTIAALASAASIALAVRAENDLDVAKQAAADADAKVAQYAAVATYSDGLTARQVALISETIGDVTYYQLMRDLRSTTPPGLLLEAIDFQPGIACAGPDPFTGAAVLGCVQLRGTAPTAAPVGTYVDDLNALPEDSALTQAFVSSLSSQGESTLVEFSISVNYTSTALSNLYVDQEDITSENLPEATPADPSSIDTEVEPVDPATTPTEEVTQP